MTLKLPLLLLATLSFALVACGDDPTPSPTANCAAVWTDEFATEFDEINAATNAWVTDQSAANCTRLTSAYETYIAQLRTWEACARQAGVLVEWNEALSDAEAELAAGIC